MLGFKCDFCSCINFQILHPSGHQRNIVLPWNNVKLCSFWGERAPLSMGNQQLIHTSITSQLDYRSALQSDLCMSLATHLWIVQKLAAGLHFCSSSHHFMFLQFTESFTIDKSTPNSKRHLNQWVKSERKYYHYISIGSCHSTTFCHAFLIYQKGIMILFSHRRLMKILSKSKWLQNTF